MFRKTLLALTAAAAMMGAASSANAFGIAIGFGGYGYVGGGYGSYYVPSYDYCRKVIVGYRTKKVWYHGYYKWVEVPIYRTRCH